MHWTRLKDKVYFTGDSMRDVIISNTTRNDWKLLTNYVNGHYHVNWVNVFNDQIESKINFSTIEEYWDGSHNLWLTTKIWISKICIICHFYKESEIELYFDPNDIVTIGDHQNIINFMSDVSNIICKPVLMTPENEHNITLVKVCNDCVEIIGF